MPQYRTLKSNFFKRWSSEMAYVLGYIAADGAITIGRRGNHYLDIQSIDRELIKLVQRFLGSNHKVSVRHGNLRWQPRFRLQVGNKEMVDDLAHLGVIAKKAKRMPLPSVPSRYFPHFVRGYFDGDGNVGFTKTKRKDRPSFGKHLHSVFTSCSKDFLEMLQKRLREEAKLKGGSFFFSQKAYRLAYAGQDSIFLYDFMYREANTMCLQRKQKCFTIAIQKFLTR